MQHIAPPARKNSLEMINRGHNTGQHIFRKYGFKSLIVQNDLYRILGT